MAAPHCISSGTNLSLNFLQIASATNERNHLLLARILANSSTYRENSLPYPDHFCNNNLSTIIDFKNRFKQTKSQSYNDTMGNGASSNPGHHHNQSSPYKGGPGGNGGQKIGNLKGGISGNAVSPARRNNSTSANIFKNPMDTLKAATTLKSSPSSPAANAFVQINGERVDASRLQSMVLELKNELLGREELITKLEAQVKACNQTLSLKNNEVASLKKEIDKLRSVLDQTTAASTSSLKGTAASKMTPILENPPSSPNQDSSKDANDVPVKSKISAGVAGDIPITTLKVPNAADAAAPIDERKKGVSGESASKNETLYLEKHNKDIRAKQMIKDAILKNDFLKNLDQLQIKEIVDCMYEKSINAGQWVIREGDPGQHLFVLADGELEVFKNEKSIGKFGPGNAFGELALLYNCARTASIKALSDAKTWVLDRKVFQVIMMKTGLQRQEENIKLLRSVPLLRNLPHDKLAKLAGILEVEFFHGGEYIIREGTFGDDFFIIISGQVLVTQKILGRDQPQEVRKLNRGDYFGERALLKEDRRTANVIALIPGVECLTIDRDSFVQLIGDLKEFQDRDYGDEARGAQRISTDSSAIEGSLSSRAVVKVDPEFQNITLHDIETIACLGQGGFGRVELVHIYSDPTKSYALKCITKQYVVESRQQEHIYNEKKIMMEVSHPFICRCFRTFKDPKYVYLLLEVCLGGEVWTILRDRNHFDDSTARFYTACMVEALGYLHDRGIIYRDLKPENMLLDNSGYCKLVDFGFAKRIGIGRKTWTFCGTPEYVAPEIILNKGHDQAVDYWAIGILMYELLTGMPPFTASEPMKTYNLILKGVDMLVFPRQISKTAQSLIKKLCRDNPAERLGYQKNGISDIRKHKWFHGFDWEGLVKKQLTPPIKPIVTGAMDHRNFDIFTIPADFNPPDETSGWDDDF